MTGTASEVYSKSYPVQNHQKNKSISQSVHTTHTLFFSSNCYVVRLLLVITESRTYLGRKINSGCIKPLNYDICTMQSSGFQNTFQCIYRDDIGIGQSKSFR